MPPSIACITYPEPVDTKICPDDPGDVSPVPPLVAAIAVALHTPPVNVPTVTKFPNVVITGCEAVDKVVAVLALPSKAPTNVPSDPLKTLLVSVASGINLNLLVLSSNPKKPNFAPPSLYLNFIPLSKLSSVPLAPISKIGSAIATVVESTVVVVPETVKLPVTVKLSPTVTSEVV